ncbi:MAG: site-specific integrase [Tenacibaculum sp.]|uniref:tyrosine-type recombinase/integrase n=1 Tax=Tenacibaculum sp. TaxID=1906242 RepID=UPI0017ADEFEE|nr:site-specific integrase [Tenacibaculum sp.]NVK08063.1 site-specific integrase [Tenacibaculum sp.]
MAKQFRFNVSIYLDTRRKKENGKYPAKLKVYCKKSKKKKLYNIDRDFSKEEFEHIWENGNLSKLRKKNREALKFLNELIERAEDVAKNMEPFTLEKFEKKFFRKSTDGNNLIYHYNKAIEKHKKEGKIGSANGLLYSLKSIQKFIEHKESKKLNIIPFDKITDDFLNQYERFMYEKGKSVSTVGIYLRDLRRVFNWAINEEDISRDIYPFGKDLYQISKGKKVKKALNDAKLNVLFNSVVKTSQQQKAKDFWFFSFCCNGMNIKDIALLKHSDLESDKFSYYRAKTFSKNKVKEKIIIYFNDYIIDFIDKYKVVNNEQFIFDIINSKDDEESRYKKIKNFTRFINQHFKKLAKNNGIDDDVSSYWARHSFATKVIRDGNSMEFVSQALNHSDVKVTQSYFDGFEDETIKEYSKKLMNF